MEPFEIHQFAQKILEEKELIKKIKIVCYYQKHAIHVFFDTTSVAKAELARLFMEQ